MARYMVKRTWDTATTDEDLLDDARRSFDLQHERFHDVTWEHSHVVNDTDGRSVSYCIYQAPGVQRLLDHADAIGGASVDEVLEIGGDLTAAELLA